MGDSEFVEQSGGRWKSSERRWRRAKTIKSACRTGRGRIADSTTEDVCHLNPRTRNLESRLKLASRAAANKSGRSGRRREIERRITIETDARARAAQKKKSISLGVAEDPENDIGRIGHDEARGEADQRPRQPSTLTYRCAASLRTRPGHLIPFIAFRTRGPQSIG